ncbi:MAG: hypothetical protein AB8F74_22170 [Saprospiraceae bacterium]
MFQLMSFFDEKMKANFTTWDFAFLKVYGALFGLVLGAFFPEFVKAYLFIFVGLFVVLLVRYLYLLFAK